MQIINENSPQELPSTTKSPQHHPQISSSSGGQSIMHIETLANLQTEEKMNGLVTEIDSANSKIRLLEQTVSTLIAMMS